MFKGVLALILGLVLLVLSGSLLFLNLNTNFLADSTFYKIGRVEDYKGQVYKFTDKDKKKTKIDFGHTVYSNQAYILEEDSYLELRINDKNLNIIGPAQFHFNVVRPEDRSVFINFSEFTEILPKDFKASDITLTYKGWIIEPFFQPQNDLEASEKTELDKATETMEEPKPEDKVTEEPQPIPEEEKASYLEEIISIKRPLLKKCYENYLKENPLATGELVVEFTLQNNGRVSSARVKDSTFFRGELFKTCIVNVFKQIRSRPFAGETLQVSYPIEFY